MNADRLPKKQRIEYLDVFRAFGIILMIMGHIGFGTRFDKFIHGFHVPMFFFVSGMLYAVKYREGSHENGTAFRYRDFVFKKIRSLLIPYVCFGLLQYALWLSIGQTPGVPYARPLDFLSHLFWMNHEGMDQAGALWFLTALFVTEIIYAAIDLRIKGKCKYFLFLAIGLTGNLFRTLFAFELPFSMAAGLSGVSLFALGNLFESHREKNRVLDKLSDLPILPTLLMGAVSGLLIKLNQGVNMRTGAYGNLLLYYAGVMTAVVTGINLAKIFLKIGGSVKLFDRPKWWLLSIGRNSIIYLCLNQIILIFCEAVFSFVAVALLQKILVLLVSLLILAGMDAIIRNSGFDFMIGKIRRAGDKTGKWIKKQGPAFACYLLICIVLIGAFALRYPRKRAELMNETVTLPEISAEQLRETNPDSDVETLLKDCLQTNLAAWDQQEIQQETMRYAYTESSRIPDAKRMTVAQENQIEQCEDTLQDIDKDIRLPNLSGNLENAVRPWAHVCFSQASALYCGLIDETKINSKTEFTKDLIDCLAENHRANRGNGWGDAWQSALWAENVGFSAWLLWPELPDETRLYVLQMVIFEADRFIAYEVPYYRDASGVIVYPDDTKGEENAWNSRILSLAACMLPEHEHADLWERKAKELLASSTAVPSDVSNPEWAGRINGSNINEDGTVVNHGRIHVDYASCIMEGMIDTWLIYTLAGKTVPEEATHNFEILYSALVNTDLGKYEESKSGSRFYAYDAETGLPTAAVTMPQENDWGGKWYASYYLNDVIADCLKADGDCPEGRKAADWAKVHLETVRDMLRGTEEGHAPGLFFAEEENNFVSGETYQTHCLIKAYMLYLLT